MLTERNQAAYRFLLQLIRGELELCEKSLDKDVASAATGAERIAIHAIRLPRCLAFEQGRAAASAKQPRKSKKKAL